MTLELSGPVAAVAVGGELDLVTGPVLTAMLLALIDGDGNGDGDLDLDLGALSFIDASGLRAIATVALALQQAGSHLTVKAASPRARRLLSLAGMEQLVGPRSVAGGAAPGPHGPPLVGLVA